MRSGFAVLIATVMLASPVFAQNEALRGKMAMSVYVSIYGDNEIDPAAFRLSLEQQFTTWASPCCRTPIHRTSRFSI